MMTPERLKAIKERCERATEGPWEVEGCGGVHMNGRRDWYVVVRGDLRTASFWTLEDAEFAAHAREDVPALVAEVEQLHRFAKEIRRTARHWRRRARVMMAKGKASDRPDDAHWFAGQAEAFEQAAWDLEIILVELLGGNENAE